MDVNKIKEVLTEGNKKWQTVKDGVSDVNNSLNTVVLSCIDSRVPVERIFQTKPGELLVLKNAGNLVRDDVVRSIVTAVYEIRTENVIILGHSDCGMGVKDNQDEISCLKEKMGKEVLSGIRNRYGLDPVEWLGFFDEGKWIENAFKQAEILRKELGDLIPEDKLPSIIVALYDIETGSVEFL